MKKMVRAELYRNTVRLKINLPVVFEKQEIWRYDEAPVLYVCICFARFWRDRDPVRLGRSRRFRRRTLIPAGKNCSGRNKGQETRRIFYGIEEGGLLPFRAAET
jgi:hypothetical protein